MPPGFISFYRKEIKIIVNNLSRFLDNRKVDSDCFYMQDFHATYRWKKITQL